MASAGIQFVSTASLPSGNDIAALPASGDAAPVDFAALLFAAQAAPIVPGFVDLEGVVATGVALDGEASDETDAAAGTTDLALLLGGLILPQPHQGVKTASTASASTDLADDTVEATATSPGKLLAALASADGDTSGKPVGQDAVGEGAAKLAESLDSLPGGNAGNHNGALNGNQFGHLLGNHGVGSAAQPQGGAPAASAHVATALHDPQWGQDFSQRVVWMARSELQSAHLSLNPANLGPIEVTLNLGAEQATAVFSSPHGEVREALEAALPRLREMLAGAGIALGDAQVNAQSQRDMAQSQQPRQHATASGESAGAILGADDAVNAKEGPRIRTGLGLVDTFA